MRPLSCSRTHPYAWILFTPVYVIWALFAWPLPGSVFFAVALAWSPYLLATAVGAHLSQHCDALAIGPWTSSVDFADRCQHRCSAHLLHGVTVRAHHRLVSLIVHAHAHARTSRACVDFNTNTMDHSLGHLRCRKCLRHQRIRIVHDQSSAAHSHRSQERVGTRKPLAGTGGLL